MTQTMVAGTAAAAACVPFCTDWLGWYSLAVALKKAADANRLHCKKVAQHQPQQQQAVGWKEYTAQQQQEVQPKRGTVRRLPQQ